MQVNFKNLKKKKTVSQLYQRGIEVSPEGFTPKRMKWAWFILESKLQLNMDSTKQPG